MKQITKAKNELKKIKEKKISHILKPGDKVLITKPKEDSQHQNWYQNWNEQMNKIDGKTLILKHKEPGIGTGWWKTEQYSTWVFRKEWMTKIE